MKLICAILMTFSCLVHAEELVIYSARNEQLIKPIFDLYKKETGVDIKFITDKEAPFNAKIENRRCKLTC